MATARQEKGVDPFEAFDKIDGLRTDYIRELSGLSKIFVTISTALLGLTLAPLAPDLFTKVGLKWLMATWIVLAITATLGFMQIFFFASRFKARADYLWACTMTDVVVQTHGSDEKLDEFLNQGDRFKRRYDLQFKISVALIVGEAVALLTAFGLLARFMWLNFAAKGL